MLILHLGVVHISFILQAHAGLGVLGILPGKPSCCHVAVMVAAKGECSDWMVVLTDLVASLALGISFDSLCCRPVHMLALH